MYSKSIHITKSTGIIATLKDGVTEIHNLSDVRLGELILSSSKNYGLVLNLQKTTIILPNSRASNTSNVSLNNKKLITLSNSYNVTNASFYSNRSFCTLKEIKAKAGLRPGVRILIAHNYSWQKSESKYFGVFFGRLEYPLAHSDNGYPEQRDQSSDECVEIMEVMDVPPHNLGIMHTNLFLSAVVCVLLVADFDGIDRKSHLSLSKYLDSNSCFPKILVIDILEYHLVKTEILLGLLFGSSVFTDDNCDRFYPRKNKYPSTLKSLVYNYRYLLLLLFLPNYIAVKCDFSIRLELLNIIAISFGELIKLNFSVLDECFPVSSFNHKDNSVNLRIVKRLIFVGLVNSNVVFFSDGKPFNVYPSKLDAKSIKYLVRYLSHSRKLKIYSGLTLKFTTLDGSVVDYGSCDAFIEAYLLFFEESWLEYRSFNNRNNLKAFIRGDVNPFNENEYGFNSFVSNVIGSQLVQLHKIDPDKS